jgi:hypothetical protein
MKPAAVDLVGAVDVDRQLADFVGVEDPDAQGLEASRVEATELRQAPLTLVLDLGQRLR